MKRYSRQYLYNLRSELYWLLDQYKVAPTVEDKIELSVKIGKVREKLGGNLVPLREQRTRDVAALTINPGDVDAQQRASEVLADMETQIKEIEEELQRRQQGEKG